MAHTLWYFELLGQFRAESHARSFDRFRTQKTASLLAYLVLHTDKPHTRETLIDQFWPESTFEAGQTNLRVALNSLRKQLEPPGFPSNSLLIANRDTVRIVAEAIETDVAQFAAAVRRFQSAAEEKEQIEQGGEAIRLYKGRLLPALYDDWILREQQHLETLYLTVLRRMTALCERTGDLGAALEFALRAVDTDPLNEEHHADVLRLYLAAEQPGAAVRHFHRLEALLREQLDSAPSQALRAMVQPWLGAPTPLPQPPPRSVPTSVTPPQAATTHLPEPSRPLLNPALPPRTGPLYGRDEECSRLPAKFQQAGPILVTLTGPGGVGKTRLATEVAHCLSEQFGERLAFVPLAEFIDAAMIPFAIMQAFQLRVPKQIEPVQAIAEYLGDAPALVVLDNFEQLMPSGIEEVQALRARIPNLKLLVTSRHILGLAGEQIFNVLPLAIPPQSLPSHRQPSNSHPAATWSHESLLENSSIQLFIERAQALRPDFQITPRNASELAGICAHLEGMPLAIELAASWINVLTPSQILERFQFPSRTLTGRRRDISPRHRTVQSTISWSYQLLSPALQQALCLLSVFRGGWTLEAVEAILPLPGSGNGAEGIEQLDSENLIDALAELQERSLIFAREEKIEEDLRMRYRMLESVREFCADQWGSEETQAARQRHADYFLEYSLLARQDYDTQRQYHAVSRLFADYENNLAAMEWLLSTNDTDSAQKGLTIAVNLNGMWYLRGMYAEGKFHMERALAHPCNQIPTVPRASLLNSLATYYSEFGDTDKALALMNEGLAIRRALGREGAIGSSLNSIGSVLQFMGHLEDSLEAYREAVALFRKGGRPTHVAIGLRNQGIGHDLLGQTEEADRCFEESLEICRRENYTHGIYTALGTLANRDYLAGRHLQARARYEECVAFFRECQNWNGLVGILSSVGRLYHDIGESAAAAATLTEALTLCRQMDDKREIILLLEHIAYIHGKTNPRVAARICGSAQAGRDAIQNPKPEKDQSTYTAFLGSVRLELGEQDFTLHFESGFAMEPDAAIDFALASLP